MTSEEPHNGRRRPPRQEPAPTGTSTTQRRATTREHTPPDTAGRTPPADLPAERALLGAVLLRPTEVLVDLDAAGITLDPQAFYHPGHRHIWDALVDLDAAGEPIDAVTVAGRLRDRGHLDHVGGPAELVAITAECPSTGAAVSYAGAIIRTHRRRTIMAIGSDLVAEAAAGIPYYDTLDRVRTLAEANGHPGTLHGLDVVDLGPYLTGDLKPERPAWLTRTDGRALLYPGRIHDLHAEPSVGKSWLALTAIAEVLGAGGSAILIDYEDSAPAALRRLITLGVDRTLLHPDAEAFAYVSPAGALGALERAALHHLTDRLNPDLIILDGVAAALARDGYDENSNADVTTWAGTVLRPLADTGAAVLLLDHVTKPADGKRARGSRGAGAKLGMIDGASYLATTLRGYSKAHAGAIRLTVAKDRPGEVGAIGETAADVTVTPSDQGNRVAIVLKPAKTEGDGPLRPTGFMARLSTALERAGTPLGPHTLAELVPTRNRSTEGHRSRALDLLIAEGYVEAGGFGPGGSTAYRHVRRFTEDDDAGPTPPPAPAPPSDVGMF